MTVSYSAGRNCGEKENYFRVPVAPLRTMELRCPHRATMGGITEKINRMESSSANIRFVFAARRGRRGSTTTSAHPWTSASFRLITDIGF
jgi:hypothetical protein